MEQNPKYFDDLWNCTCLNDEGNEEFDNFWRNSGSCCDNRRLSIWIIFNILFFIAVLFLWIKIRKEKRKIQRDLGDFEIVDTNNNEDGNNSSVTDSITEKLNR